MGLVFCIHSVSLYLLVSAFKPFTFKVIIDTCVPIGIFLIVLGLFLYFLSLVFTGYVRLFNICCKAGLVVLNSFNLSLSVKVLISPSILNETFASYSNCGCRFFSFTALNISCHPLLACRVSAETSAVCAVAFSLMCYYLLFLCFF